jgi:hypothetical protein
MSCILLSIPPTLFLYLIILKEILRILSFINISKIGFLNITTVRKTPHTTHKGGSREVSHVQKFNKQVGWLRKNGAAAFLGGSGLK